MLVMSDGTWIGGISGGCLEGDALKKANFAIYKNEPSITLYDTTNDDDQQIGVGLGCNGKIQVMFKPVDQADPKNDINLLKACVDKRETQILLTVQKSDSPILPLGHSHLIRDTEDLGLFNDFGSQINAELDSIGSSDEISRVIALDEGAQTEILIEYIKPRLRLLVCGDNYDIIPLIAMAKEMDWIVEVCGASKKLTREVFNTADLVLEKSEVDQLEVDGHTAILLMAHDYKTDLNNFEHFLPKKPTYLGLLGPKKRFDKMLDEMNEDDVHAARKAPFVHSPVGLDIGATSPDEIAISIISEIVAVYGNRPGSFLKNKPGTIHDHE